MSTVAQAPVLRFVRRIAADDDSDGQLLNRYLIHRDECAFAEIVKRHGSMVLGVCRRILGDGPDADDAFQVTFLIFLRRANSLRKPNLLAGWLHGVAYRTALHLRRMTARRRERETPLAATAETGIEYDVDAGDLRDLLDREVARLPEKYRLPVVLCHFNGMTHEQAARHLGCPRATVTTRLARACRRLRSRLVRRGVTMGGCGSAGFVTAMAGAAVAENLLAVVLSNADGSVSNQISFLFHEVLRTMYWNKIRKISLALLAIATIGLVCWQWTPALWADSGEDRSSNAAAAQSKARATLQAGGNGPALDDYPPVVVKTFPQAGSRDVDASKVKEIRATFSHKMVDKSWSVVRTGKDTFPKITGKVSFDAELKTIRVPVKLEPGRVYVLWFNHAQRFRSFRSKNGKTALPYMLVFSTKK